MADCIRWGIIGCGGIASHFAKDLKYVPDAKLVAVGSRNLQKATRFADEHGAELAFGSYEELAASTDVDVVYIATPHPMHFENTMLCLGSGKHVLCEKPFAINTAQAKEMIDFARQKNLFLMEAMWTRFIPATLEAKQLLEKGVIGDVKAFAGDFCINFKFGPEHRAFNPDLGGGALLDLGVYPVSFASMVFGKQPKEISSVVQMGPTRVDVNESISFLYDEGQVSSIYSSCVAESPIEAVITGTKGRIKLHSRFFHSEKIIVELESGQIDEKHFPIDGVGYWYEAEHVCECLRSGKKESEIMSLDETLEIMQTLDRIREQWGLVYPCEK